MNAVQSVDSFRLPDYDAIEVDRCRPMGSRVYIEWQARNKYLLGGKLIMPDTHRGTQFTGKVIKLGDLVPEEYGIKVGDRVIFRQFSGFEKRYDDKKGRIAIVDYLDVITKIPDREDVTYGEDDFNYDE